MCAAVCSVCLCVLCACVTSAAAEDRRARAGGSSPVNQVRTLEARGRVIAIFTAAACTYRMIDGCIRLKTRATLLIMTFPDLACRQMCLPLIECSKRMPPMASSDLRTLSTAVQLLFFFFPHPRLFGRLPLSSSSSSAKDLCTWNAYFTFCTCRELL
jgi:hypothetical protein